MKYGPIFGGGPVHTILITKAMSKNKNSSWIKQTAPPLGQPAPLRQPAAGRPRSAPSGPGPARRPG